MSFRDILRGLFSSSANQAVKDGGSCQGTFGRSPTMNPAMSPNLPDPGELRRPPVLDGNPQHSYLGGLVRYQRPDGQTDRDRMALIGSTMADMGAAFRGGQGGSLARTEQGQRQREQLDKARGMVKSMFPDDPAAETMFELDPDLIGKAWLEAQKPTRPRYIEGPDGIYALDEATGRSVKVQSYAPKPNTTAGQINPATGRWEWAPGYLDSQGALATTRRKAVVANPMPSRAKAGGAAPWLPPGAKILHVPGS